MYALLTNGNLRVGSVAPNFNFSNETIYQTYDNQNASSLNPAVQDVFFMIEDDTLDVNVYSNGTGLAIGAYIDAQAYLNEDKVETILFGGGGTAWNLCVWYAHPLLILEGGEEYVVGTCMYTLTSD